MLLKFPEAANEKTRELILYVADRLKDEPNYGATLLNKALYFIDNISYLINKEPVSNFRYVKQGKGPTPMPSQFLPLKRSLIESQDMAEISSEYFALVQKKCIPKRQPNTDLFTKDEIILMDKILSTVATHSATSISEITHRFLAWQLAENMEELPYFTYMLTSKPPSENDIAWAEAEIQKYTA